MEVKNKIAIVTGASSGIGMAAAKLLSKNGARVVLAARSKQKIEKLAKILPNSLAIQADMTNEKDIENIVSKTLGKFGKINILINNAGQGYDSPIEKTNLETFRNLFELDLVGPIALMKLVIPTMRKQKEGVIINVSSGTALMALPGMGGYSSLKRALAGISLTAREELKKDNIVVSVIFPYITLSDFEKNTIREIEEDEWQGSPINPPDTSEFVAEKILEGIRSGEAEIFAHDWMDPRKRSPR